MTAIAALTLQPEVPSPSVQASFGHYQPARTYTEQATSTFYLPMRDGVRLAVTVSQPAVQGRPADGRFPVIWHHSLSATQEPGDGTGRSASAFRAMPRLTDYGYVVVQVARRGTGQSFGARRGYHDRNEAQDAYDVTQWLAVQPWSTGRVGMYGCSNTGDAAMHAVSMRPPALRAAFAGCFSWNKYDAFRRGGIFAQWGTGAGRTVEQDMRQRPVDADTDRTLLRQAAEEHQLGTQLFDMWREMPFRDSYSRLVGSRFWSEGSVASYQDQVRRSGVALYIVGGWSDELRDQGLLTYLNAPGSRIVIGPWQHCMSDGFALFEEAHRFFDEHLKDIDTGLSRESPIHYMTVNAPAGSEWRAADRWPLASATLRPFALGADGSLLNWGQTRYGAAATLAVNYEPTCANAGEGPYAQPCHAAGGVSYTGTVLRADTEVTGSGVLDLWIAADTSDANVFAYVEDVAPDGTVQVVTEGRLRASLRAEADAPWRTVPGIPWHRSYAADAAPLTPGHPVRLSFEIMPTSYVFRNGHRIQVTVAGADYRERARDMTGLASVIQIYTDREHPSTLRLPVVAR